VAAQRAQRDGAGSGITRSGPVGVRDIWERERILSAGLGEVAQVLRGAVAALTAAGGVREPRSCEMQGPTLMTRSAAGPPTSFRR
jgi:hypothetical protein